MSTKTEVADLIAQWGVSNSQAAKRLGMSRRSIVRLKGGQQAATPRVIEHIRLRIALDLVWPYIRNGKRVPSRIYWKIENLFPDVTTEP